MKKLLLLFASLFCLANIWAYDFEQDGIYYNYLTSGSDTTGVEVTYVTFYDPYLGGDYTGEITIPDSVNYNGNKYPVIAIGDYAFNSCTSLSSLTIPDGVTSIGQEAFASCESLSSLAIPEAVTFIGKYAFFTCISLTTVNIPDGVTVISAGLFDSSGLTTISLPKGVTTIEDRAFEDCDELTSFTVLNPVPVTIDSTVFEDVDQSACTLYVPYGSESAYESADVWEKFYLPEVSFFEVDGIYYNYQISGSDTTGLEVTINPYDYSGTITIPDSVSYNGNKYAVISIGDSAFYSCYYLNSVSIPEGVTSIGERAFIDCVNLTSVSIPSSVDTIGDYAFRYCERLVSVSIPDGVTTIGTETFLGCFNLPSITIPSSVTSIGDYAFMFCQSLSSVTIPSSVDSIGHFAFSCCTGLPSITIPDGVTFLGEDAFSWCTSLTSATIPSSVTTITSRAFEYCDSLTSLTVYNPVPVSINSNVFQHLDQSACTLYVPKGSVDAYKSADVWKEFNIVELAEQTTAINETTTSTEKTITAYYNITGAKLPEEPEKGIYVVLYSDGTSEKMMK